MTSQPGAVPFGLGRAVADGMSQACLRLSSGKGSVAARPQRPQPGLQVGVHGRGLAHDRGDGLPGQVVRGRPQAAGRDHEVGPLEPPANASATTSSRSGRAVIRPTTTPGAGQRRGELAGVRVAGLADGQLRADAQQLGGQDASGGWAGHRASVACASAARRAVTAVGRRGRRVATRGALSSAGQSDVASAQPTPPIVHHGACALSLPDRPSPCADPPPGGDAARATGPPPPGLRAQIGATRDAAHGAWSRPTSSWPRPSCGHRRRAGQAVGLVVAAIVLVLVRGQSCSSSAARSFLGEWLFGSMGWGVLHGVLLFVGAGRRLRPARPRHRPAAASAWRSSSVRPRRHRRRRRVRPQPAQPGLRRDRREPPAWRSSRASGRSSSGRASGRARRPARSASAWRFKHARRPGRASAALLGLTVVGAVVGAFTAITSAPGRDRARHRRRLRDLVGLMGIDVARTGIDVEALQATLHPDPDDRDQQGDARVATPTDAARDRVLAARADLADEFQVLEASGRAAVDIPAKIRRSPAKAAAVAGGVGFLALKGPQRLFGLRPAGRRAARTSRCPKSMLPGRDREDPAQAGLRRRQGPGHARARLRRLRRRSRSPRRRSAHIILSWPSPSRSCSRAARASAEWLFSPGQGLVRASGSPRCGRASSAEPSPARRATPRRGRRRRAHRRAGRRAAGRPARRTRARLRRHGRVAEWQTRRP